MNYNEENTIPALKAQWEANKAEWEKLCDEQENLPREGFAEVFKVLDGLEETFTPQHPYTENLALIDEALKQTGHATDEAFCEAFKRNNQIMIDGNRLVMANALLNIQIEQAKRPQPQEQPEGWRFYSFSIFAPQPIHTAISEEMERQALNGEGLFSNITEVTELPDEALDELFGVEVYNVVCSLQPYHGELRRYGVTGQTLGKDFTRLLFQYLKKIADHIKANTNKPEAVKSYIFEAIKNLDDLHIWGLLFQILILDGLCYLLRNCTLKEGDNGYNEAYDLLKWILEMLCDKLIKFTYTPYGEEDKQRLQPLCNYLYDTEIGRAVQERIFERDKSDATDLNEPSDTATMIANRLSQYPQADTPRARKYIARAVECSYAKLKPTGFEWRDSGKRGALVQLGYFVEMVYCPTNTEEVPEQAINKLFGVNRISSAIAQAHNAKKPQKWRAEIETKIFYD